VYSKTVLTSSPIFVLLELVLVNRYRHEWFQATAAV